MVLADYLGTINRTAGEVFRNVVYLPSETVYERTALILAGFMGGLALGGWIYRMILKRYHIPVFISI